MYGNQRRNEEILELRRQGGKWLKSLREAAGLTQAELAERLEMDVYTFISQLENGRGRIPPERYENWAAALNVPLVQFVRRVLSYYDPITYRILFGSGESTPVQPQSAGVNSTEVIPREKVESLRAEIRELQRLLGKKSAEVELLKERLQEART